MKKKKNGLQDVISSMQRDLKSSSNASSEAVRSGGQSLDDEFKKVTSGLKKPKINADSTTPAQPLRTGSTPFQPVPLASVTPTSNSGSESFAAALRKGGASEAFQNFGMATSETTPEALKIKASRDLNSYTKKNKKDWNDPQNNAAAVFGDDALGDEMRKELQAQKDSRKVTVKDFFRDPLYAISAKAAPIGYDLTEAWRTIFDPQKHQEHEARRAAYNALIETPDRPDTSTALQGVVEQGANEFNYGLASTADMLVGKPLRAVGWENNPVSALKESMKTTKDTDAAFYAKNMENASQAAKTMEHLGVEAVAAAPDLLLAYFTGGGSLGAQEAGALTRNGARLAGKEAAVEAAKLTSKRAAASEMARQVSKASLSNPMFWTSFSRTAGPSYEQAKEAGASDFEAALYGTANAIVNAQVEIGGGIQTLPWELRQGGSAALAWIKSMGEEGREEVVQGVLERALQNLTYGADNPVFSVKDENAILNPVTAAKEFASGAAVAGILGAPSAGISGTHNLMTGRQAAESTLGTQEVVKDQSTEPQDLSDNTRTQAVPQQENSPQTEDPAVAAAVQAAMPDAETAGMTREQKGAYARKLMDEGVDPQEVFRRVYGNGDFSEAADAGTSAETQETSPALEKLGVKISSPVAVNYNRENLLEHHRNAKTADRKTSKAIRDMKPTRAEREFAEGLANGTYQETDIPMSMDKKRILELSDLMRTREDHTSGYIAQIKRDIKRNIRSQLNSLFETADLHNVPGAMFLNFNTMQRNIRKIFKGPEGDAINEYLFDPILENSAEMIRFQNRMLDRVRSFNLSKDESLLVARVLEGSAVQQEYAMLDPETKEYVDAVAAAENPEVVRRDFGNVDKPENYDFAMEYKEWLETQARMVGQDTEKITAAAEAYKAAYNDFYDAINDFLVNHGYEPIGFIKGYTPHLQSDKAKEGLARALQRLGIDTDVTTLPTDIAGRTDTFKPGKRWDPRFLHRDKAHSYHDYDAAEGYENYVFYMANVLYHTDDIMKLRETANYFRERYATDDIKDMIEQARDAANRSTEEKTRFLINMNQCAPGTKLTDSQADEQIEKYIQSLHDDAKNITKYSDFVTVLDDYTNRLAGKQTKADRAFETRLGRLSLNVGNKLTQIFGESTIVGNLSSALNQSAQLPFLIREVGVRNTLQALRDVVTGDTKAGGWESDSDFLTGKRGVDGIAQKSGRQKVMDFASIPFEAVDDFMSRIYVRGKYIQSIKEGNSHAVALKDADEFATKMVGSRIQGAKPMIFEDKKITTKALTTFQLEIANSWAYISQDLPAEYREYAKKNGVKAAAAKVAGDTLKYLISAWLMNWLADEIYGGSPAPFDLIGYAFDSLGAGKNLTGSEYMLRALDNFAENLTGERKLGTDEMPEGFDAKESVDEMIYNGSRDIPYVNNAMSILGLTESRMPLPTIPKNTVKDIGNLLSSDEDTRKNAAAKLAQDAPKELRTWLPIGNQLYKTGTGALALARGGSFSGSGENEQMQYQTPRSLMKGAQSLLFGKNATKEAREWFASGYDSLSKKETQAFRNATQNSVDEETAYQIIRDLHNVTGEDTAEKNAQKRKIIKEADVPDRVKRDLYSKTVSDSRDDVFRELQSKGVSFNKSLDLYEKYLQLDDDEDLQAGEKATEFAKYVDSKRFTEKQAALAKDSFKFWMNIPANADQYEKFKGMGMSSKEASDVMDALNNIEIDPWKDQPTYVQKYTAIVESGVSEEAQSSAIKSMMSDSIKLKYEQCEKRGVSPSDYVQAYQNMLDLRDKYGKSNTTERIAKEAIDMIPGLSPEQRAVLWQIQSKSWKASKNPYSQRVGAIVRTALYDEPENDGALSGGLSGMLRRG